MNIDISTLGRRDLEGDLWEKREILTVFKVGLGASSSNMEYKLHNTVQCYSVTVLLDTRGMKINII